MQGASRESAAALRDALATQTRDVDAARLAEVSEGLFSVVTLLAGQGQLRRTLSDPALEPERKVSLVDRLLADRVDQTTLELVRAGARLRWSSPRDLVDGLEALAVEASLQQAEAQGVLDEVEDELFRFERIVDSQPELRAALTDRTLPADRKTALLDRLLSDRVAGVSLALIQRGVLQPRGRTIERVLEDYSNLAAKRRERRIARVTTAVPLTDDQQQRLAEALRAEYGDVRLQVVVDRSLVGGLTVRIGDELIDGSVVRHLATARRHLTGGSRLRP